MKLSMTTATASGREWRCGCGALLGMHRGGEVHIKYKDFSAVARGRVELRCRRCGAVSATTTELQPPVAA